MTKELSRFEALREKEQQRQLDRPNPSLDLYVRSRPQYWAIFVTLAIGVVIAGLAGAASMYPTIRSLKSTVNSLHSEIHSEIGSLTAEIVKSEHTTEALRAQDSSRLAQLNAEVAAEKSIRSQEEQARSQEERAQRSAEHDLARGVAALQDQLNLDFPDRPRTRKAIDWLVHAKRVLIRKPAEPPQP
jgi:hypothetical protein